MSLEIVKDLLLEADRHQTAVLAFDAVDYVTVTAVIEGAQRAGCPVIVMLYPQMAQYCTLEGFTALVKETASKARIPVGLHLDHCSDFEYIVHAMRKGFTSVMADGSMFPLEENIRFTSEVVHVAKVFGADVEGELGHVGKGSCVEDYAEETYTSPEEAKIFTEAAGVASLAVAFGSAHGVYRKEPRLDIRRLIEINEAIDTPLVLHGGSGIPDEQIIEAFQNGINKMNIGTELFCGSQRYLKEFFIREEHLSGGCGHLDYAKECLAEYVREKCKLTAFRSGSGKDVS